MSLSDEHLEKALEEYNAKVSQLETDGSDEEMFEALVNRSTILLMLEYYTSCMSDVEDALSISQRMLSEGMEPNAGSLIKLYENRGQISFGEHDDVMISDYSKIIELLDKGKDLRHYSSKDLVDMCIGCADDLISEGYDENALPFVDHGLSYINGHFDRHYTNCRIQLLNMKGQIMNAMGLKDEALAAFTDSALASEPLYRKGQLEDDMDYAVAYVFRGDIKEALGDKKGMVADHESAVEIVEEMYSNNKLGDLEVLVNLHQGLASALMELGEVAKAESHLIRVVKLGLPGMKDAMDELGIRENEDQ